MAPKQGIRRLSGRAGGTEGGLSTGELLRVRAAMKPIATVPRALRNLDVTTGEVAQALYHQRSDVSAVPAAGTADEAMVALVLAAEALIISAMAARSSAPAGARTGRGSRTS